ncbi:MAG: hypothetical protein DHS20C21_13680 [Gemmatimonadota bacterium]|nr:MAG: hypothetical protein DHS20C21_13680 [Gemmatimonadota bacterium]
MLLQMLQFAISAIMPSWEGPPAQATLTSIIIPTIAIHRRIVTPPESAKNSSGKRGGHGVARPRSLESGQILLPNSPGRKPGGVSRSGAGNGPGDRLNCGQSFPRR